MPSPAELRRLVETFDWPAWNAKVKDAIDPSYRSIALDQAATEAEKYDLEFNPDNPFVDRWFTRYVGERITQISETTRDVLREELQSSLEDGHADSMQELAGRLRDSVENSSAFSASRTVTISRTETAIAYNHGALLTYDQNGISEVEVSDGDEDEDCAEADGQIWSVDDAMEEPTAHPNCVRSFAPVLPGEDDEE